MTLATSPSAHRLLFAAWPTPHGAGQMSRVHVISHEQPDTDEAVTFCDLPVGRKLLAETELSEWLFGPNDPEGVALGLPDSLCKLCQYELGVRPFREWSEILERVGVAESGELIVGRMRELVEAARRAHDDLDAASERLADAARLALEDLERASERLRIHQVRGTHDRDAPIDVDDPRSGPPLLFTDHVEEHIRLARRRLLSALGR